MTQDACSICRTVQAADDLWRITRRPNDQPDWVEEKCWGDKESVRIEINGPEHRRICSTCWHEATGFLERLHEVRHGDQINTQVQRLRTMAVA